MKIILFDAVGTLIFPVPDVVAVYQEFGSQFGATLGPAEVEERISEAYRIHFLECAQVDSRLISSDALEKELWQRVVFHVFQESDKKSELFNALWNHFARPDAWKVYPDVPEAIRRLKMCDSRIGIASNFDSRLKLIVQESNLSFHDGHFVLLGRGRIPQTGPGILSNH